MEGPNSPEHTSVADLLDRRRSQPRTVRRNQGHTIKREETNENCNSQEDNVCELGEDHQQHVSSAEDSTHKDEEQICDLTYDETTLVDIHILGLFQQIERYQRFMLSPSEEQVNEIDKHARILQQSESEMDTKERASIKGFKETVQYERCCSFLNYDNFKNLSEADKQAYEESHANQVSATSMTREEVEVHCERGKQLERDWSRKAEGKGKEEFDPDNATLMISDVEEESMAPLHGMTCVGVDTCSAKSISCEKEDFLDLQLSREDDESNVEYELRGVGGV